jgi:hypothetical protein
MRKIERIAVSAADRSEWSGWSGTGVFSDGTGKDSSPWRQLACHTLRSRNALDKAS